MGERKTTHGEKEEKRDGMKENRQKGEKGNEAVLLPPLI